MGISDKEKYLRLKYSRAPEESTAYAAHKKKRAPSKSKHKHVYRNVVVHGMSGYLYLIKVCGKCGKCGYPIRDRYLDGLAEEDDRVSTLMLFTSLPQSIPADDLWDDLAARYGRIDAPDYLPTDKYVEADNAPN